MCVCVCVRRLRCCCTATRKRRGCATRPVVSLSINALLACCLCLLNDADGEVDQVLSTPILVRRQCVVCVLSVSVE